MAFAYKDYSIVETLSLGTSMTGGVRAAILLDQDAYKTKMAAFANWENLGNTAAGTSGTSGTTVGGGNYTWVG